MASGLGIDDLLEWSRRATLPMLDPHQALCSMLRTTPNTGSGGSASPSARPGHQIATRSAVGMGAQQRAPAPATNSGGNRVPSFTVPTGGIGDGEAFEKKEDLTAEKEEEMVDLTSEDGQGSPDWSLLPAPMDQGMVQGGADLLLFYKVPQIIYYQVELSQWRSPFLSLLLRQRAMG